MIVHTVTSRHYENMEREVLYQTLLRLPDSPQRRAAARALWPNEAKMARKSLKAEKQPITTVANLDKLYMCVSAQDAYKLLQCDQRKSSKAALHQVHPQHDLVVEARKNAIENLTKKIREDDISLYKLVEDEPGELVADALRQTNGDREFQRNIARVVSTWLSEKRTLLGKNLQSDEAYRQLWEDAAWGRLGEVSLHSYACMDAYLGKRQGSWWPRRTPPLNEHAINLALNSYGEPAALWNLFKECGVEPGMYDYVNKMLDGSGQRTYSTSIINIILAADALGMEETRIADYITKMGDPNGNVPEPAGPALTELRPQTAATLKEAILNGGWGKIISTELCDHLGANNDPRISKLLNGPALGAWIARETHDKTTDWLKTADYTRLPHALRALDGRESNHFAQQALQYCPALSQILYMTDSGSGEWLGLQQLVLDYAANELGDNDGAWQLFWKLGETYKGTLPALLCAITACCIPGPTRR